MSLAEAVREVVAAMAAIATIGKIRLSMSLEVDSNEREASIKTHRPAAATSMFHFS
ncbi:hypothetical protein [Pandoraea communis]|uniref:hypothetical protein n=1 Tax=Pandoraea communis TaxID=2508297 RepID=UPI00158143BD|nr:hypothetical protein [Pandoraea communis]MDM8358643.1 hypothetical protein [Pandoraea communis]